MRGPSDGQSVLAEESLRVLVVEDCEELAALVCTLLTGAGYLAEAVATGQAALARLQAGAVDLVLLDLMLPDMSGMEVCRAVRAQASEVYLPVLMLTALVSDAQRVEGFAAGADDYITKPFLPQELLARVQVWSQTRQRLAVYQQRLDAQTRALQEAERRELTAQLDGIKLAARELTDLINNSLAIAKATLELVELEPQVPPPLQTMAAQAQERLADAGAVIQRLERVVRVQVKQTATGPALDLARSTVRDGRRS
jgi:DNA-binding response OmpR family regulator